MTCNVTLPISSSTNVEAALDVVGKFNLLSAATLNTNSIYMRAKDTFKELFDGKSITTDQYASFAGQFVSQLATQTTVTAMQTALQWAKEEREGVHVMETLKAQAEVTMAQREKIKYDICKLEKDVELSCAQLEATIAASIRDNGRVSGYDLNNPCKPISLQGEGTKHEQIKVLQAQSYSTLADAYRKSGVVAITTSGDGYAKGSGGDTNGYTYFQMKFAERQIKSFEDSKRSHAANAASQMIGQLYAVEANPDPSITGMWTSAMTYLNTNTP